MRVRANSIYTFNPVFMDINFHKNVKENDKVRVINKHGCPKANVMNHCFIEHADTKEFIGLVCCNSLTRS